MDRMSLRIASAAVLALITSPSSLYSAWPGPDRVSLMF